MSTTLDSQTLTFVVNVNFGVGKSRGLSVPVRHVRRIIMMRVRIFILVNVDCLIIREKVPNAMCKFLHYNDGLNMCDRNWKRWKKTTTYCGCHQVCWELFQLRETAVSVRAILSKLTLETHRTSNILS